MNDSRHTEIEQDAENSEGVEAPLRLIGAEKHFGAVQALRRVDLSVPKGQLVTLLGPSGSGKTTLLRMIAGFDVLSGGKILLNGRNVSPLPPAKRGIGMVFQNYALFPHLSVSENIGYGLKMRNWSRKVRNERIEEMLALVRLQGLGDRKPRELSGGQQQRVALVRALAPRPSLLLMDEPLGALDRALRIDMTEEIRRLHRELETTTIYVTHDREEALTLSDRIIIMRDGAILADGTPKQLYENPASAFAASFFGGHNVLRPEDVQLDLRPNGTPAQDPRWGTIAGCGSAEAPEDLGIAVPVRKLALTKPEAENSIQIPATITETLFFGDYVRVTCRTERRGEPVTAWLDTAEMAKLRPNAPIELFGRQCDCVLVALDN